MLSALFGLLQAAAIFAAYLLSGKIPLGIIKSSSVRELVGRLLPFVCVLILTLIFSLVNRKKFSARLLGRPARSLAAGAAVGAAMVLAVAAVLWLAKSASFDAAGKSEGIGSVCLAALAQACTHTLISLGFIYELLRYRVGSPAAWLYSVVCFTLLELLGTQPNAMNVIAVASVALALCAVRELTESVVAPAAAYSVWLIAVGPVLGIAMPGADYGRLIGSKLSGPAILTGGSFGVNASAVTVSAALIAAAACAGAAAVRHSKE
ncbi:MAG: hypothetical protein K6C36_09880 [Clostridia bacterium]|nr:hypothetical protein [Clostridia bacterium]